MSVFNVVVIGEHNVGKTTILQAMEDKTFHESIPVTTGYQLALKIPFVVNGDSHWIYLWDTAGLEEYRSIAPIFYRGSVAAIVVYDITEKESFDNIDFWRNDYLKDGREKNPMLIIGNKDDLSDHRAIPTETGSAWAHHHNYPFLETSAKSGDNISQIIPYLSQLLQDVVLPPPETTNYVLHAKHVSCC